MCELCNKIYNEEEYENWLDEWYLEDDRYTIISKEKNKFYLYRAIGDNYYTPQTALEIKYCPECGKNLNIM